MSSYHILNAIWIGVFPMLAVTVLIGVFCYILCCLNQIKNKCKEHSKKKSLKKTRKRLYKQQQKQSQNESISKPKPTKIDELDYANSKSDLDTPIIINKLTKTDEIRSTDLPNRSNLTLNLSPVLVVNELGLKEKNFKPITRLAVSKTNSSFNELKNINSDYEQIEQLVVQDLSESPTNFYSKFRIAQESKVKLEKKETSGLDNVLASKIEAFVNNIITNSASKKLEEDVTSVTNSLTSDIDETPKNTETKSVELKADEKEIYKNSKKKRVMDTDDTQNDYDDDYSTDITTDNAENKLIPNKSSPNRGVKKKKQHGQHYLKSSHRTVPFSSSQLLKSPDTSSFNDLNKKAKLLTLSKNVSASDIEIEDDFIFNDGDDSLSSTGICVGASQHTLVNQLNHSLSNSKRCSDLDSSRNEEDSVGNLLNRHNFRLIDDTNNENSLSTPTNVENEKANNQPQQSQQLPQQTVESKSMHQASTSNYLLSEQSKLTKLNSKLISSSSMSDIDPDENILKNLLIKNKIIISKTNSRNQFK